MSGLQGLRGSRFGSLSLADWQPARCNPPRDPPLRSESPPLRPLRWRGTTMSGAGAVPARAKEQRLQIASAAGPGGSGAVDFRNRCGLCGERGHNRRRCPKAPKPGAAASAPDMNEDSGNNLQLQQLLVELQAPAATTAGGGDTSSQDGGNKDDVLPGGGADVVLGREGVQDNDSDSDDDDLLPTGDDDVDAFLDAHPPFNHLASLTPDYHKEIRVQWWRWDGDPDDDSDDDDSDDGEPRHPPRVLQVPCYLPKDHVTPPAEMSRYSQLLSELEAAVAAERRRVAQGQGASSPEGLTATFAPLLRQSKKMHREPRIAFEVAEADREILELPPDLSAVAGQVEYLRAQSSGFTAFPDWIGTFTSLRTLCLSGFVDETWGESTLTTIPPSIGDLVSLKTMQLAYFPQLEALPTSISRLTALETLVLHRCSPVITYHCSPDSIYHCVKQRESARPCAWARTCKCLTLPLTWASSPPLPRPPAQYPFSSLLSSVSLPPPPKPWSEQVL